MSTNTVIKNLKNDIAKGRVAIITGTGVSVASCDNPIVENFSVTTWPGLLKHGVEKCKYLGLITEKTAEIINQQIESDDIDMIISAAETMSLKLQKNSPGTYRGWLKETVGALKPRTHAPVLDALHAMPGILATLNYDGLMEAYTERQAINWCSPDKTQDVLTGRITDAVLHLHGWFDEPESVVLGNTSYSKVKNDLHAQMVLRLFTIDRTLLFVGCGDTVLDPNFCKLIEWGKEALKDVTPRHTLLCRNSEIAAFREKLKDAPWLQILAYGTNYNELAPFLDSLRPQAKSTSTLSLLQQPLDLSGYQLAMRKQYGHLKLEELDPTTYDVQPLALTEMFIAQDVRECVEFIPQIFELPKELQQSLLKKDELGNENLDEKILEQYKRAYRDRRPLSILDLISDTSVNRLVILGDPGSGKSSLLQYLLLQWANKSTAELESEPVPILIELREYARSRQNGETSDFLDYLCKNSALRWNFDHAQLQTILANKSCLLLFDGLDEVFDTDLRVEITNAIYRLADSYTEVFPNIQIVVTSRVIGFQHQSWCREKFQNFMLQELDEDQINDFLSRWHKRVFDDAELADTKLALLNKALQDSPSIRQLASNPMLLTMMAILNRTQDLPRDRAELYEQCARLLLHQWKLDTVFSNYPELAKASLDYKDKRSLLLHVAYTMQTSEHGLSGNYINETSLEQAMMYGLKGFRGIRPDRAARALIEHLRGRNFMLCSIGGEAYAFIHRTFLEYFCAVEIRERFQTEQTLSREQLKEIVFAHWDDETWHEVLRLLAGMLAPHIVAEIIDWLLEQNDPTELYKNIFLAASCLGEIRKRNELGNLSKKCLIFAKAATQSKDPTVFGSFFKLIAQIWNEDEYGVKNWLSSSVTSNFFNDDLHVKEALNTLAYAWRHDSDTFSLLIDCIFASNTQETAFIRAFIIHLLDSYWCGDIRALPIIKDTIKNDPDDTVRSTAIDALANGWYGTYEFFPLIKALGESNESFLVRTTALRVITQYWSEHPETLNFVINRAKSDSSVHLRLDAIEILEIIWGGEPDVLQTAKFCLLNDLDSSVREAAIDLLTSYREVDPDVFVLIKSSANGDVDATVRLSAINALLTYWNTNIETVAVIQVCAQLDADVNLRQIALTAFIEDWKENPETLSFIKSCAQLNESVEVRIDAIIALAYYWEKNDEILLFLKSCAENDHDPEVRLIAENAFNSVASREINDDKS